MVYMYVDIIRYTKQSLRMHVRCGLEISLNEGRQIDTSKMNMFFCGKCIVHAISQSKRRVYLKQIFKNLVLISKFFGGNEECWDVLYAYKSKHNMMGKIPADNRIILSHLT